MNQRQQLAPHFETLGLTEYASRDDVERKFAELVELFDPEQFQDYPTRYAQMAREDRRNVEHAYSAITGLLGGGTIPSLSTGLTEVLTEEAARMNAAVYNRRAKPKPPKHV
ncbi:MAG: hypothetical protein HY319_11660 [Armatimonadetes bacterium]|nr:hypothetical protein [Armatimonadota bacterium]